MGLACLLWSAPALLGTTEPSAGDPHLLERKLLPEAVHTGKWETGGVQERWRAAWARAELRTVRAELLHPRGAVRLRAHAAGSRLVPGGGSGWQRWGAGHWRGSPSTAAEVREVSSWCKTLGGLAARNTWQCQVCMRAVRLGFIFQVLLLL